MKKRTSKQIFAETFLELCKDISVDKITVKKIVEESGLSLKTFYNHFPDKYALMLYIEQIENDRLYAKLSDGELTFQEYLTAGIRYYQQINHFLLNAFENTYGADSYITMHTQQACGFIHAFILKKNNITDTPADILFAERLYTHGLISSFLEYTFCKINISEKEFVRYCEECIPEKLKPYLL